MIKAVLIGYGYWGPNIARNINNSEIFELVGICDSDNNKLEKAKNIYGDSVNYYTDYKNIINDDSIKMCAVALRNDIGQNVAREVLSSGKHLFMEKPLATKMEDALILKELAQKNNVLIHVDHLLIFNPIIKYIKKMIDNDELGELISFESNRANLGPHIKKDMNAMWDLAVHDLAILDFLCGGLEAKAVNCMGERQFGEQEVITYLTIKYPNLIAMIKSSWFSPLKERMIVISGTKKMVVFNDLEESEKLTIYDKGVEMNDNSYNEYGAFEAKVRTGDIYIPNIEREDALLNSINHFGTCIVSNKVSISNEDQAIRTLKILESADKDIERTSRVEKTN